MLDDIVVATGVVVRDNVELFGLEVAILVIELSELILLNKESYADDILPFKVEPKSELDGMPERPGSPEPARPPNPPKGSPGGNRDGGPKRGKAPAICGKEGPREDREEERAVANGEPPNKLAGSNIFLSEGLTLDSGFSPLLLDSIL